MTVLANDLIERYLLKKDIKERLIVTPLIGHKNDKNGSSIDVRLGSEFIIFKKSEFPFLDIGNLEELGKTIIKSQEKVIKNMGDMFILHPHQYIIGSTLEYIQLPRKLMCYVIGKSTLGRTGLIIATATKVDPGFKGCITLEIMNNGEVPIALYPGMLIAQLVFHLAGGKAVYEGTYDCPIGPIFPKLDTISRDLLRFFPKPSIDG